jgi:hypothetical protein
MSQQAVWFQNQAQKCLAHADKIWDRKTEEELRKLAAEYIERAKALEDGSNPGGR